jgi:hypothetical protein
MFGPTRSTADGAFFLKHEMLLNAIVVVAVSTGENCKLIDETNYTLRHFEHQLPPVAVFHCDCHDALSSQVLTN